MYKLVLSIIIPLFWWLARQLVFYPLQGLVIRLGLPSHRAKQLDQALGSLFGFFLVAVIWSFPGTLTLGPLNDLWFRISLTLLTLAFFVFTYFSQDFLPKRRLIQALEDRDSGVRPQATQSLGKMGSETLESMGPEDKEELVEALGQIGPEAVPALIQLLKDQHSDVRKYAAETLDKIGPEAKEVVPALIHA